MSTVAEMQSNMERTRNLVTSGQEVIATKNDREAGCFIPKAAVSCLTDSLTGILKGKYDFDEERAERLKEKYETIS